MLLLLCRACVIMCMWWVKKQAMVRPSCNTNKNSHTASSTVLSCTLQWLFLSSTWLLCTSLFPLLSSNVSSHSLFPFSLLSIIFCYINFLSTVLLSFFFTSDLLFSFLSLSSFFCLFSSHSVPLLSLCPLYWPLLLFLFLISSCMSFPFPFLSSLTTFFLLPGHLWPSTLRRCTRSVGSFPGPVHQYVLERACLNWHGSCHHSAFSLSCEGQISQKLYKQVRYWRPLQESCLWSLPEVCLLQPGPLDHLMLVIQTVITVALTTPRTHQCTRTHTQYPHSPFLTLSQSSADIENTLIDIYSR